LRSVFFGGSIAEKEKEKEKENSPHKTRPQEKPAALRFGITDTNL
jgi:hypothetical protein